MGGPLIRAALVWFALATAPALAQAPASDAPASESPAPDPDVAWALAEQETMPAFDARVAKAQARIAAREAWFDRAPDTSFEAAFPSWAGAPLNRPAALKGRLAALDAADVDRASERRAPTGELGSEDRVAAFKERRAAALAAEEAADRLERRVLVEALGLLRDHPELRATSLAPIRERWTAIANLEVPEGATDEEREAIEGRAAAVDGWLRSLDRRVSELIRGAVRGDDLPDPTADLDALADPTSAEGAAVRLGLLADMSADPLVADALAAWWASRTWPDAIDPAQETARLERWLGPESATGWKAARRGAIEARITELAPSPEGSEEGEPEEVDPADVARLAELEADAAQETADAALASAADARARRRAEVLQALASTRRRSAHLWGIAEKRTSEGRALREELDESLAGIDNDITAIRNRRIGESSPDPDAVYRQVRELSQRLRTGPVARGRHIVSAHEIEATTSVKVEDDRARIREASAWIEDTPDRVARAELEAAIDSWADELDEETRAARQLVEGATDERDAALRALARLREQRRVLQGWITASERYSDQSYLLTDVAQELSLLGPSVVMRVRDRFETALGLPRRLTDFNLLRSAILSLLWTGLWVGLWLWTRSQAEKAAKMITARLYRLRPELRPIDLANLREPIAQFLRSLTDLLLGWLLIGQIGELLPELGFLLLIYLQVALYRALLAGFDLLVIPSELVRPALVVLRKEPFELARRTMRYVIGLLIARSFLHSLLWNVLGLDVIAGLVGRGFSLAFIGLVVWSLARWEPHLRVRIARRNQDSRAVAFLSKEPENAITQPLRGLAILMFFGVAGVVDLTFWLARERSGVAWLVHFFTQVRNGEKGEEFPPLPAAVARELDEKAGPLKIVRPEVDEQVKAALDEWQEINRRGLVALVGDRGSCKIQACRQIAALFDHRKLKHDEVNLDRRLVTEDDMLGWMSEVFGVKPCASPDEMAAELRDKPQQAWILRGLHRAWTRQVEGFEAISTLLYVLNTTSDHHFWVASMHQLSWDFFASSGSLVDVAVFRTVVALQPLTAQQLRDLCRERIRASGYRLDTSKLLRSSAFGGDPSVDEERGINLFFRLLAEASRGNPSVAIKLWTQCLHPTDDPHLLLVHPGEALETGVVTDLSDEALFALVALRVQDELDADELAEVTNLPRPVVRRTVRDLISRGLVAYVGSRLQIPEVLLPAVTRTLRRRHFLHLGAA